MLAHAILAAMRRLAEEAPQKNSGDRELIRLSSPEVRRLVVRLL